MPMNEFSVYQFFNDDLYERVRSHVSAEEAVLAAEHYINNVASKLGLTKRVIITDGGDCVVYEWVKGKGVVFPPDLASEASPPPAP